jgi:hypothetical protein
MIPIITTYSGLIFGRSRNCAFGRRPRDIQAFKPHIGCASGVKQKWRVGAAHLCPQATSQDA